MIMDAVRLGPAPRLDCLETDRLVGAVGAGEGADLVGS